MPRPMLLLALIIALTATPLRLAEAAHDLARTLLEVGEDACVEEVDGGVGDDSGESIKADASSTAMATAIANNLFLSQPCGFLASKPQGRINRLPAHSSAPTRGESPRRHLWLQCFLC